MSQGRGQALGSIFGDVKREPSAPPRLVTSPQLAAFIAVVDRLESLLDAETRALTHNLPADMTDIGNRKRQSLLDLTRMMRAAVDAGSIPEIRARLERFAVALGRNQAALGTQLRAVREIADILAQAIRDADSDGTYSRLHFA